MKFVLTKSEHDEMKAAVESYRLADRALTKAWNKVECLPDLPAQKKAEPKAEMKAELAARNKLFTLMRKHFPRPIVSAVMGEGCEVEDLIAWAAKAAQVEG